MGKLLFVVHLANQKLNPLAGIGIVLMGGVVHAVGPFRVLRLGRPLAGSDLELASGLCVVVRGEGFAGFLLNLGNNLTGLVRIEVVGQLVLNEDVADVLPFR